MKKVIIPAMALAVALAACNSIPPPSEKAPSLVIGQLSYSSAGTQIQYGINLNLEKESGIEITFENQDTGKTHTVVSGDKGFFKSTSLPEGKYVIKKFYFRVESDTHYSEPQINPSRKMAFEIRNDVVNNLGQIMWSIQYDEGTTDVFRNTGYEACYSYFGKNYEKSPWMAKEHVKTTFGMK